MPPFHEEQSLYRHALTHRDSYKSYQPSVAATSSDRSRTQHKLQLQRLSFLTNDKNYLDHPQNMRRLTRELDRVEREYRNVRQYADPVKESFKRLLQNQKKAASAISIESSASSSENESSSSCSVDSDYNYSSSADKVSFLGRWFNSTNEDTASNKEIITNSNTSFNDTCNSVVYSFHPTIAHHMKQQRRAAKQ